MATAISTISTHDWEGPGAFPGRRDVGEGLDPDELLAQLADKAEDLAKARAFIRSITTLTVKPAKVESIDDASPHELQIVGYEMAIAALKARANLFLARRKS